ncbi:MAG TPA: MmcQ/YjbR family DNA-binding protein [Bryobacteraceae bacterium]|jgi:predicted DNA-binding protein (MmcQ/YjbR family)|nr:MmcQ/YjbR family DNA-binding protein [Bryobacteraceae bacterium]
MIAFWVRKVCLGLPHTTESFQWGSLVFKVGGRIFAIAALEPGETCVTLKAPPERFAELIEREGVIPAPYLARARWIALEQDDAIPRPELKELLTGSYEMVLAKLPRKTRDLWNPKR